MALRSDAPSTEGGDTFRKGPDCLEPDEADGFVQGWLVGDELARAEAHIDRCADCRRYVSDLARSDASDDASGVSDDIGGDPARTSIAYGPITELPDPEGPTVPVRGRTPAGGEVDGPERLLPRGASLGRYVVDGLLGSGGMGVVYAAYDPKLDRKVALKMVHTASAERHEARERLLREARAMARLSHPNVVTVYDVDVHEGQLFLAMEFVDGITLRSWLRRESRPAREVLGALVQAGRGLAAAHAVGVIHRDFKPDNVLCDGHGRVCVTDFGLARAALEPVAPGVTRPNAAGLTAGGMTGRGAGGGAGGVAGGAGGKNGGAAGEAAAGIARQTPGLGPSMTRTGSVMGTPAYMAPEQHIGQATDARSDQFSFCVALYEALYRQHPFEGPTWQAFTEAVASGKLRDPPSRAVVPPRAQRALLRGLSADPSKRFASMNELLSALTDDPSVRRVRLAAAAGIALTLGALGLGYRQAQRAARPSCEGAERKLAGVWDGERKSAVRAALLGTGKAFAPDTWRGVERALDAYAAGWVAARVDACEATHVRGEQSAELLDLRMACLDERLKEAGALTEVFARADGAAVGNAVGASLSLTPLAHCADRKALRSRTKPPADAATAAKVEALRGDLARAKALADAGQYREALALAAGGTAAAEALGERGLLGEALLRQGQLEGHLGKVKPAEMNLRHAISAADAAGDDDTRARASNSLLFNVGSLQLNSAALVPLIDEQSRAAIARLGGDPGLDGLRGGNLATALLRQGKFDEARREFEAAVPQLERAFGPESRQVQTCLNGLGHAQAEQGDYEASLATMRRAVQSSEATLGPQHPEVAAQLNNLGTVLDQMLRFEEAEAYFERTLAIQESALGPEAPSLWLYLNNLGDTLTERGQYSRALPYLQRALALCEKLGPDYADLLYPLSALGQAHLGLGQRELARTYLERAVKLPTYEEAAPDLAHARFSLARALGETAGERRRAQTLAEAARDALRAAAKSPLGKQRLLSIEQWLERHGRG